MGPEMDGFLFVETRNWCANILIWDEFQWYCNTSRFRLLIIVLVHLVV